MPTESKGMNGTIRLLAYVGGVIALLITIYTVFHVPLATAIQEEAVKRQSEDTIIRLAMAESFGEIKTMLAEQRADIKYIKKETANGK